MTARTNMFKYSRERNELHNVLPILQYEGILWSLSIPICQQRLLQPNPGSTPQCITNITPNPTPLTPYSSSLSYYFNIHFLYWSFKNFDLHKLILNNCVHVTYLKMCINVFIDVA